jgi:hypothetical protein
MPLKPSHHLRDCTGVADKDLILLNGVRAAAVGDVRTFRPKMTASLWRPSFQLM